MIGAEDAAGAVTEAGGGVEAEEDGGHLALLIDPGCGVERQEGPVPERAIVGVWHIEVDGAMRRFAPNRAYVPSSPDLPTDPIDAKLRIVMQGGASADSFVEMPPGATFCIGLDEEGAAIVTRAPDGLPSVLVVTVLAHAHRLTVLEWQEITAEQLVATLPEAGVDVLFNPGVPASVGLGADELRKAVGSFAEEAAEPPPAASDGPEHGAVGPL